MTEPVRDPAPDAVGDIVPGDPPVPVTVWHVPASRPGETMSTLLAERLVANFTHRGRLVFDLTRGDQLARAARAARRRHHRHTPQDLATDVRRAALIVAGWPLDGTDAVTLLADCTARLAAGGCAAVVLGARELTVNQLLIGAARAAGLTYLQHIVAAHDLSGRRGRLAAGGTHVPVHTDVVLFGRSHRSGQEPKGG